MGISGLLPLLDEVQRDVHISDLKGMTIAVDAYVWLHRGALRCSAQLLQGKKTTRHLEYCMGQVRMLQQCGITPILVFDGNNLPSKAPTENKRRESRTKHKLEGLAFLRAGQQGKANKSFQKAVDVTPQMAFELILMLRSARVDYVVAPYEADAQLAYLSRFGFVEAVITEDSDLLVYECPLVVFKLGPDGNGKIVKLSDAYSLFSKRSCVATWGANMLRDMAILSGCDYLPSLPGIGIKNAQKIVHEAEIRGIEIFDILSAKGVSVSNDYRASFNQARLTFLHQYVYCPKTKACVHLTPPTHTSESLSSFLGSSLSQDLAQGIADGRICPVEKTPFQMSDTSPKKGELETVRKKGPQPQAPSPKSSVCQLLQQNRIGSYFARSSKASHKPFVRPRPVTAENETKQPDPKPSPQPSPSPPSTEITIQDDGISKYFGNKIDGTSPNGLGLSCNLKRSTTALLSQRVKRPLLRRSSSQPIKPIVRSEDKENDPPEKSKENAFAQLEGFRCKIRVLNSSNKKGPLRVDMSPPRKFVNPVEPTKLDAFRFGAKQTPSSPREPLSERRASGCG